MQWRVGGRCGNVISVVKSTCVRRKNFPLTRVLNGELGEARLDVGLLDRTSLPLVMPALVIGKGRENHCVQLPREEVHPRAMTGENTISVGKSPCLR